MDGKFEGPILRPKAAAEYIGVSKSTFYKMIQDGHLPKPIRIFSKMTGFPKAWLDEYISRMRPAAEGRTDPS